MSFSFSPKTVTDGLVFYLDAANIASYTSGSTIWNDISRSSLSGTLVNGPTFNSANGGSIVFDGTNDYVNVAANSTFAFGTSNFSIEISAKVTVAKENQYFFDFGNNRVAFQYYSGSFNNVAGRYVLRYLTQGTAIKDTIYTLNQNQIYNYCIIKNSNTGYLFLNGTQINSWVDNETYTANNPKLGTAGSAGAELNGNIYNFKIYNRALSSQEVLQNYNATRSRFGL